MPRLKLEVSHRAFSFGKGFNPEVILSLHFNATFLLEEYKKLGGFPNPTPLLVWERDVFLVEICNLRKLFI